MSWSISSTTGDKQLAPDAHGRAKPRGRSGPVIVVIGLVAATLLAACGDETGTGGGGASPSAEVSPTAQNPDDFHATGTVQTSASGLQYIDLVVGTGAQAQAGQRITVQYTGWLTTGVKFDSSRDRGQPFSFVLGQGQVIKGWDEGVATMKIGGRRKLIIPSQLGYGAQGSPPTIPPGATLVFIVELLGAG